MQNSLILKLENITDEITNRNLVIFGTDFIWMK